MTARISGHTRIAAVFGWPVEHSLSPPMQNAAIEALGIDWVYVALPVPPASLEDALKGARAMGFAGFNCTIPHKETILPLLDEIDELARAIGAVNTVQFVEGRSIGHNTDAYGFTETVLADGELMLRDATVLVLGSGGVARAIAAGAASEGARKIILANRTRSRAEAIVREVGAAFPDIAWEVVQASPPSLAHAASRAELIVNATSLGLRPGDPLPIQAEALNPGQVVFDTVYTPPETALLRAARARGAVCVGGLGMLARQGARALAIWTGLEPDEDLMLSVLQKCAAERTNRA